MPDFFDRLEKYAHSLDDDERSAINKDLWDTYGVQQAVLVLDMSGFSRLSNKHGLTHYLSMVQRMRTTVGPVVESHDGHVVKFEADNCYARFPEVVDAVNAAVAYLHALETMNLKTPDEFDIHASIGIDFGAFLLVKKTDFWGEPVNTACRLGEDLARSGEILITESAFCRIPEGVQIRSKPLRFSVSGVDIQARQIRAAGA